MCMFSFIRRKLICLILDCVWCWKWNGRWIWWSGLTTYELVLSGVENLGYVLRLAKWTRLQQESPSAHNCMTTCSHRRQCWCPSSLSV
jgi:hypothetical protein